MQDWALKRCLAWTSGTAAVLAQGGGGYNVPVVPHLGEKNRSSLQGIPLCTCFDDVYEQTYSGVVNNHATFYRPLSLSDSRHSMVVWALDAVRETPDGVLWLTSGLWDT